MKHTKMITKATAPAPATSLLQLQQIALVFGSFATGVAALTGGLGNAFNLYTQSVQHVLDTAQDKKASPLIS